MGDAPDVKVLESVRDSVVKLSDEQMAQVLEVLDRAGRADPGDAARSDLTIAYGSQKSIATKMRKILTKSQQQADLVTVSAHFAELARRQNENFKATKRLTSAVKGRE